LADRRRRHGKADGVALGRSPPDAADQWHATDSPSGLNIAVLRDTHGKTSHLSAADIEAIGIYLRSLQK